MERLVQTYQIERSGTLIDLVEKRNICHRKFCITDFTEWSVDRLEVDPKTNNWYNPYPIYRMYEKNSITSFVIRASHYRDILLLSEIKKGSR